MRDRLRVLVAEDEETILNIIRIPLERMGFQVVTARSIAEALSKTEREGPDLAILDWVLEDGSGVALFQKLKNRYPDLLGLLITGHSATEGARQAESSGFWDFLAKPFTVTELVSKTKRSAEFLLMKKAKDRSERIARFYQRILEVTASRDLTALMKGIISLAREEGKADIASLMLVDPDDPSRFIIAAADGLPEDLVQKVVPVTEGVAGRIFEKGSGLLIAPQTLEDLKDWPLRYGGAGSALCLPLISAGRVIGLLNITRLTNPQPLTPSDWEPFELLTRRASEALTTLRALLKAACLRWIAFSSFARYTEEGDPHRKGTAERSGQLTRALADLADLPSEEVEEIVLASIARDFGMVRIPEQILKKPAPLSDEEWMLVKQHPKWSLEILDPQGAVTGPLRGGIFHHHERFGGGGYPFGLKGEEIPLSARIISVADTFDALTRPRPYRPALSHQQAVQELLRLSGQQLDPDLTQLFVTRVIPQV
ncbi:MAG: response regulator [Armatimonadetes bacterium]|nr:response regulator [Armatimonadota bacterium]MDW8121306.1 response regulator [Armatimonadota bacterium]